MNKLFLLCALICAGQMYGMEEKADLSSLPKDVQGIIIRKAFEVNKNLDETIKTIEAMSTMQGMKYSLNDFTKLVHLLAKKFNMRTQAVAEKFTTPVAKRYLEFGNQLFNLARNRANATHIIDLINKGADVNFDGIYIKFYGGTDYDYYEGSPLSLAIMDLNVEAVKTLLKFGAQVTDNELAEAQLKTQRNPNDQDAIMVKQLIIKAWGEKYLPSH